MNQSQNTFHEVNIWLYLGRIQEVVIPLWIKICLNRGYQYNREEGNRHLDLYLTILERLCIRHILLYEVTCSLDAFSTALMRTH